MEEFVDAGHEHGEDDDDEDDYYYDSDYAYFGYVFGCFFSLG